MHPTPHRGEEDGVLDDGSRSPLICVSGDETKIHCFHADTLKLMHEIPTISESAQHAVHSLRIVTIPPEEPDDEVLVAVSQNLPFETLLYNPYTKKFVRKMQAEPPTNCPGLSYLTPSFVVSGDFSGQVDVSNVRTGKKVFTLKDPPRQTYRIVCGNESTPDALLKGKQLVFVSGGNSLGDPEGLPIRLYDLKSERPDRVLRKFAGHTKTVAGLSYSSNDGLLFSTSDDMALRVWSIREELATSVSSSHTCHGSDSVLYEPESHLILCGVYDGFVEVFDIRKIATAVRKFRPHPSLATLVYDIVRSPTGRAARDAEFASVSDSNTVAKWTREGKMLGSARTGHPNTGVCFVAPESTPPFLRELEEERMRYFLQIMLSGMCEVRVGEGSRRDPLRFPLSYLLL